MAPPLAVVRPPPGQGPHRPQVVTLDWKDDDPFRGPPSPWAFGSPPAADSDGSTRHSTLGPHEIGEASAVGTPTRPTPPHGRASCRVPSSDPRAGEWQHGLSASGGHPPRATRVRGTSPASSWVRMATSSEDRTAHTGHGPYEEPRQRKGTDAIRSPHRETVHSLDFRRAEVSGRYLSSIAYSNFTSDAILTATVATDNSCHSSRFLYPCQTDPFGTRNPTQTCQCNIH